MTHIWNSSLLFPNYSLASSNIWCFLFQAETNPWLGCELTQMKTTLRAGKREGGIKDILEWGRTWEFRFAPGSPRAARAGSRAGAPKAAKGTAPICGRDSSQGQKSGSDISGKGNKGQGVKQFKNGRDRWKWSYFSVLKWKLILSFSRLAPFLIHFQVEMAMGYVKRQFNNIASLQMSPSWLKSSWESRRLPKAAPVQMRWLRQTPKPNPGCQDVLGPLTVQHLSLKSHHRGAGSSLGFTHNCN